MSINFTKVENFVLQRLEVNARYPFTNLTQGTKPRQQLTSYTLKSLRKKGVVKSTYTLIDYSKFDTLNFRVYFKVNYISEKKYTELLDFFIKSSYTSKIISCSGQYDLICVFFSQNASQFYKTLRNIMQKFPDQLQNYMILTTVVGHELGKKYLFEEKTETKDVIIGGDRPPEDFDKTDLKILQMLSQDARINSVKIANTIRMSPRSIIYRIRKLEKKGVVKGYRAILDLKHIGYNSNLLLIKYHNISAKTEKELITYLKLQPNVVSYIKVLGNHDLEVIIDTQDQLEYRKIEFGIRQKFANIIQNIENVPIFNVHKINFFPEYLLGE
ncbi:MAG: Lrp/AsnC family transcriptional regulator [Candidatus Nanoarchaeia archaeon]